MYRQCACVWLVCSMVGMLRPWEEMMPRNKQIKCPFFFAHLKSPFLFTFYPWTDNVRSRLLAHTHKHSLTHVHLDKLKLECTHTAFKYLLLYILYSFTNTASVLSKMCFVCLSRQEWLIIPKASAVTHSPQAKHQHCTCDNALTVIAHRSRL